MADQPASLTVNAVTRNAAGGLDWGVSVSLPWGKDAGPCAVVSPCYAYVQAKRAIDGTTYILADKSLSSPTYVPSFELNGTSNLSTIVAMRLRIGASFDAPYNYDTPWTEVSDPLTPTAANLVVNSLTRTTTGSLTWNVDASVAGTGPMEGPCATVSPCYVYLQAKKSDGEILDHLQDHKLAYASDQYGSSFNFSGTSNLSTIVAMRLRIGASFDAPYNYDTPWTEVSENTREGHDLDSALALMVNGLASSVAPCIELFPEGTHQAGSSLNDQQLECSSAMANGKSLSQFISGFVKSASAKTITKTLVAAGVSRNETTASHSLDLDYGKTLPAGCSWTGLASIYCAWASPETFRPISAPPELDPTWRNNQRAKIKAGTPVVPPPPPVPSSVPQPTDTATSDDYEDLLNEQCATYSLAFAEAAGLADDECSTTAIFGTGSNSPEATQHDLEALETHPSWISLTYVSPTYEKSELRNDWSTTSPCNVAQAGYQCDEFPYFSSEEGWPMANPPSLKMIPSSDNASQGGKLTAFYKKCGFASFPRGTSGRRFLVVPLPVGVPTTTTCGAR